MALGMGGGEFDRMSVRPVRPQEAALAQRQQASSDRFDELRRVADEDPMGHVLRDALTSWDGQRRLPGIDETGRTQVVEEVNAAIKIINVSRKEGPQIAQIQTGDVTKGQSDAGLRSTH